MSRRSVVKHGKLCRDQFRDLIDGIIDRAVQDAIPEFVALVNQIFCDICVPGSDRSSQLEASAKTGLYIAVLSPEQTESPSLGPIAVGKPNGRIIGPQYRWIKPSTIIIDEGN